MIPLASIALSWTRLPKDRGLEIHRGNELLGTLLGPGPESSSFVAQIGSRKWIFRRSGFLGTSADVLELESRRLIATFKSSWRMQGVLTFADGQSFFMECKGVWHPVWNISDQNREPILSLHSREQIVENRVIPGVPEDRFLLLTMFSLYRLLQAEEDAASAAIVAVFS